MTYPSARHGASKMPLATAVRHRDHKFRVMRGLVMIAGGFGRGFSAGRLPGRARPVLHRPAYRVPVTVYVAVGRRRRNPANIGIYCTISADSPFEFVAFFQRILDQPMSKPMVSRWVEPIPLAVLAAGAQRPRRAPGAEAKGPALPRQHLAP